MRLVPFKKEHFPAAAKLAAANHAQERTFVPSLPIRDADHYIPLFERISKRGPGVAALDQDESLIGYMIGLRLGNFKGTQNGVHVPEWANAAIGPDRFSLIRSLYEYLSAQWVENGCFAHGVSLYAHDEVALDTWFRTAFGMICGDGVRDLVPVQGNIARDIVVRKATVEDIDLFLPLVHEHSRYYPTAPLFMPLLGLDGREHYEEWLEKKDHTFWLALDNGEPIGYFESTPSHPGARELIIDPGTCSICGAFVKPGIRQSGVGAALLSHIIDWARENGYERCAVDYETHNIYGSRFWLKHFTPVTASVMRKIDERVAWGNSKRSAESIW